MKKTRMPLVHPANLVANSGNALFGVVLLMHALDTCFWHQSPHTSISTHDVLNFVGELLTIEAEWRIYVSVN